MKKKIIKKSNTNTGAVTKDYFDKKIDQVMLTVAKGFEANDKRFDRIETRMDSFETRMERMEGGYVGIRQDIKELNERVARLEDSMDNLMNTLDRILKKQDDVQDEFTIIKARMDKVEKFIFKKFGFEISAI